MPGAIAEDARAEAREWESVPEFRGWREHSRRYVSGNPRKYGALSRFRSRSSPSVLLAHTLLVSATPARVRAGAMNGPQTDPGGRKHGQVAPKIGISSEIYMIMSTMILITISCA